MAMSIFEIQVVRDGRWIASDAFENYEAAYECAARIEQNQRPEPLRIRRIDLMTTGTMRERTMYDGGQKPRREMAVERQRQEQDALRKHIADRHIRRIRAKNAAGHKNACFSSNHPVYLTLVSLSIFLTGLSAMYLVDRAFMYYRRTPDFKTPHPYNWMR